MRQAAELDQAIKAVCPIVGVSVGKRDDKATWKIHFAPEATAQQQAAAQSVVAAFVWDDAPDSAPINAEELLAAMQKKGTPNIPTKEEILADRGKP